MTKYFFTLKKIYLPSSVVSLAYLHDDKFLKNSKEFIS